MLLWFHTSGTSAIFHASAKAKAESGGQGATSDPKLIKTCISYENYRKIPGKWLQMEVFIGNSSEMMVSGGFIVYKNVN